MDSIVYSLVCLWFYSAIMLNLVFLITSLLHGGGLPPMRQYKNCNRMMLSVVIVLSLLLVSIIPQVVEVRSEGKHKLIWEKNLGGKV